MQRHRVRPFVHPFVPWLQKSTEKPAVCRAWLMSRDSSSGRWEVTRGKTGVDSMACTARDRGSAWRTYAAIFRSVWRPTSLFIVTPLLYPVTRVLLDFLLFWPQNKIFRDSSWNISVSSLVILAASVFEISHEKQTNSDENLTHRRSSTWVMTFRFN